MKTLKKPLRSEQMRHKLFSKRIADMKRNVQKNYDLDESVMSDITPNANDLSNSKLVTDLSTILKQTCRTSDDEKASTFKKVPATLESEKKELRQARFYDHSALQSAPKASSIPTDLF